MQKIITGVVIQGHRIASGLSDISPYPKGSLEMQAPHFREKGLDLEKYHLGTLNIDISPRQFKILDATYKFVDVEWAEGFPAETFSFVECEVCFDGKTFNALIYYPHPETKIGHFQSSATIEVMASKIDRISYGSSVDLIIDDCAIEAI